MNEIEKIILDGVKYVPSEHEYRLSASELGSGLLEIYLKRKYSIPDNKISQATLGSLCHLGLELIFADVEGYETEKVVSRLIPGTKTYATATIDLVGHGVITDWKTTKEYTMKALKTSLKNDKWKDNGYCLQLNHQNWVLGSGYSMQLAMFMKDAKVDMKTGSESKTLDFVEVPLIPAEEYENIIKQKALYLERYIDTDMHPDKCTDLWPRKIGGVTTNTKCRFYCNVNSVCPYYENGIAEETQVEW